MLIINAVTNRKSKEIEVVYLMMLSITESTELMIGEWVSECEMVVVLQG